MARKLLVKLSKIDIKFKQEQKFVRLESLHHTRCTQSVLHTVRTVGRYAACACCTDTSFKQGPKIIGYDHLAVQNPFTKLV